MGSLQDYKFPIQMSSTSCRQQTKSNNNNHKQGINVKIQPCCHYSNHPFNHPFHVSIPTSNSSRNLTPDSRNLKKHKDELLFLWSVDSKNPPNFARMCFQEFLEEKIEVRRAVKCVFQQQKIANFMNWKKKKRNKFWFPKII